MLVHAVWLLAARHGLALWVERVPSEDHIADGPSRNNYAAVERVQATWSNPVVPAQVWQPHAWIDVEVRV